VHQKFRLSFFFDALPVRFGHHFPGDLIEVRRISVVQRVSNVRVPVRERPRSPGAHPVIDGRAEMDDLLLAALVVGMSQIDDVEHYRARAEVERDVVTQKATRRTRNGTNEASTFDMRVADVCRIRCTASATRIGVKPSSIDDARQVVHLRDVEDLSRSKIGRLAAGPGHKPKNTESAWLGLSTFASLRPRSTTRSRSVDVATLALELVSQGDRHLLAMGNVHRQLSFDQAGDFRADSRWVRIFSTGSGANDFAKLIVADLSGSITSA